MIAPQPYKLVCSTCGYSKVIKPKSDVVDPRDRLQVCPKCKGAMNKTEPLNIIDKIFK
jgi:Zn finger protein HypA/HybF involved in hydrogenase expression